METALSKKLDNVRQALKEMGKVAVMLSGGINSSFLLKIAEDVVGPHNIIAITANTIGMPRSKLNFCKKITSELGIKHLVARTREFMEESYLKNDTMRCYVCRIITFKTIMPFVPRQYKAIAGANAGSGNKKYGLSDVFPEKEFDICVPLKDAGLSKPDIGPAAEDLGFNFLDSSGISCLATRIPAGSMITEEKIRMVEEAEELLSSNGFKHATVLHYGGLAKIETGEIPEGLAGKRDLLKTLDIGLKRLGFKNVALDLKCFS